MLNVHIVEQLQVFAQYCLFCCVASESSTADSQASPELDRAVISLALLWALDFNKPPNLAFGALVSPDWLPCESEVINIK